MNNKDRTKAWNDGVFVVRLIAAALWTAGVFLAWVMWTGGALQEGAKNGTADPTVDGMVMVCTSGCCGSGWLVGMLALLAVFAVLRR